MAYITCKGLTYAPYTSGGDSSAIVYGTGKAKTDYLCRVEMNENRNTVKEHADGHQIDSENSMDDMTINFELANVDSDIKTDILGMDSSGTGASAELVAYGDDAPFVGIGFIIANRFKGTTTYNAYWIYKAQFSSAGVTAETRREQTSFQHETINGSVSGVKLSGDTQFRFRAEKIGCTSESDARTWLNGKAGITG